MLNQESGNLNKPSLSVSQWVTSIVNVESKSRSNLNYLNNILGPIRENRSLYSQSSDSGSDRLESPNQRVNENGNNLEDGFFTHEIIFKINEKVFVESLNIYEKVVADSSSSILKIEALEIDEEKSLFLFIFNSNFNLNSNVIIITKLRFSCFCNTITKFL